MDIRETLFLQNPVHRAGYFIVLPLLPGKHHDFQGQRTIRQLLDQKQLQLDLFLAHFCDAGKLFYDKGGYRLQLFFFKAFKAKKWQVNSFFPERTAADSSGAETVPKIITLAIINYSLFLHQ